MGHSLLRSVFVALAVAMSVAGPQVKAESVTFNLTSGLSLPSSNPYTLDFSSINVVDVDGYTGSQSISGSITFNESTDQATFTLNGVTGSPFAATVSDVQTPVLTSTQVVATADILFASPIGAQLTQLNANIELSGGKIESGSYVTVSAVPEPSSIVLGGLALLGVGGTVLRRKRATKA